MPSNACSRTIGLPRSDRYVNGIFSSPEPFRISALHALGQLRERPVDVEADVLREALQQLEVELVAPVPAADRAGRERQLRKRDDALRDRRS